MPYTGLNSYSPLSAYQGTVINTDILDSYERHVKPWECAFTTTSSTYRNLRVLTDSDFTLKKGTRIRCTFKALTDYSWSDPYNRNLYVNGIGPYPIVTNGTWPDDDIPITSNSVFDLIFNGSAWELENSLLGMRNVTYDSTYHCEMLEDADWWDGEVYHGKSIKTIPQTNLTYIFSVNSIYSNESVGRLSVVKSVGDAQVVPGFYGSDFYGVACDVAYIQGATYVVRSEWDDAADDPDASAVTSLWKSTDGINFTRFSTIRTGVSWDTGSIKYNGTYWLFVPMDRNTTTIYYSTNGTTWNTTNKPSANWYNLSVANGRFYLTNIYAATSTAYYATNPTSWSSCSLPSSGFWRAIAYSPQGYYHAYGGSAESSTANAYVAYSTSGTGSWTNTTVLSGKGPIISVAGDMLLDDSSLGWDSTIATANILIGNGYYGYAYYYSSSLRYKMYNYFDDIVMYGHTTTSLYGEQYSIGHIGGDQLVCALRGNGPTLNHTTTRELYIYREEYTVFGELATGPLQGIDVSKVWCGMYAGNGTYGSSNKNIIYMPFLPKFGIVRQQNSNFYTLIFAHPRPRSQGYNTTDITARMHYAYNSFHSLYQEWDNGVVKWYSTSSAAYQLNTSGTFYNYVFFG